MHILLVEIYIHTRVPTHTDTLMHTPQACMGTPTHTQTHACTHRHPYCRRTGEGPFPYSLGQSLSARSLGGHSCSIQCPGLGMCSARLLPLQTCVGKKVRSRADWARDKLEKNCSPVAISTSRTLATFSLSMSLKLCQTRKSYVVISVRPEKAMLSYLSDQEKLHCHLCQTRKSYAIFSVGPGKATLSSLSGQEKWPCHLCHTRRSDLVISVRPGKWPCHLCQTKKIYFVISVRLGKKILW